MKKTILLISTLSLLFASCNHAPSSQYAYRPPENISDGLDVGSLGEVNTDSALIVKLVNTIHQGIYKEIDSMEKSEIESIRFVDYRESFLWLALAGFLLIIFEVILRNTVFRRIP